MINVSVVVYLAAIVSANLSILYFGPAASIFNAFFLIGLDLSLRDYLHEKWKENLKRNMGLLIVSGSALTVLLNLEALQIAIASAVAFGVSSVLDSWVYYFLKDKKYLLKSNVSNAAGSFSDSIIFPVLAFGGFPWIIILGQFFAKWIGGFVWSYLIYRLNDTLSRRAISVPE